MIKKILTIVMALSVTSVLSVSHAKDYIGGNFQLKDSLDTTDFYCLDVFGFGINLEMREVISARTCKNPGWPDTTFRVDYPDKGQIYAIDLDLCVEATNFARGAHIIMQSCSDSSLQRFIYAEDQTVRLRSEDNSRELCMVVNPSAGIPMDGGGLHLRREILFYECARSEEKYAQWVIPEGSEFSPAMAAKGELVKLTSSAPAIPGQSTYTAACSRCHGVNAEGIDGMQSPRLAGLSPDYIKLQFDHFVSGVRGSADDDRWAAQMTYYVRTLSDRHIAELDNVFAYIAKLPEPEIKQAIDGDTSAGKELYEAQCTICHGANGQGVAELKSPRLLGLQDWYLLKQMEKFRDGRRGTHADDTLGAQMAPFAKALSNKDIENIVAYLNQL